MSHRLLTHRFVELDTLIDGLHALFEQWLASAEVPRPSPTEGDGGTRVAVETLEQLRLATHEWLANLIQHADFEGRSPDIRLSARLNAHSVECVIEDNSAGFDMERQLQLREERLEALPERGMGLLMLRACAQDLVYECTPGDVNRLTFVISADQDPWLNIPF